MNIVTNEKFRSIILLNLFNRNIQTTALASCTLHDLNVSPLPYDTTELHPLTFFVKGKA